MSPTPFINDQLYNALKYVVQIVLPGAGTLYFTLAQIWNLPYGEQVVGTLTAIALFGGLLIGLSKHQYDKSDYGFDGSMNVDEGQDEPFSLEFKQELPQLSNQETVRLKVNKRSQ